MQAENSQKQPRFDIHFKKFVIFLIIAVIAGVVAYGSVDISNLLRNVSAVIMLAFVCLSLLSFIKGFMTTE